MTTVVVAGALGNKAGSAGEAWVRLSWVRGLQRLGTDVWFVEELAQSPADDSPATAWFRAVTERFGLHGPATLLSHGGVIVGPSLEELLAVAPEATLVNISGHLTLPSLFGDEHAGLQIGWSAGAIEVLVRGFTVALDVGLGRDRGADRAVGLVLVFVFVLMILYGFASD